MWRNKWRMKLIFVQININVYYKLILSFLIGLVGHAQSRHKFEWSYCCMQVNIKVFHKLVILFLTGLVRHAQSTKNKFAISKRFDERLFCMWIPIQRKKKLIIFGLVWFKNGQGHSYCRVVNLAILTSKLVFGSQSLGTKSPMKLPLSSGEYVIRSVGQ